MCRVEAAAPSVKISTSPSQGPFRVGQTVQFTCEVEPAQEHFVTYRWFIVENIYGPHTRTSTSPSFNQPFYYEYTLRYCRYICTVALNGIVLGSADKLVEVHGKYHMQSSDNMYTHACTHTHEHTHTHSGGSTNSN